MADITGVFKATIKTVKMKQKSQGKTLPSDKSILGVNKRTSEFSTKAKDVVKHITKLKEFLLEHRRDYINASGYLCHENGKLTDAERDQIDADAEKIMKMCQEAIKSFKVQAQKDKALPQVKEHRDAVLNLVNMYLKEVCKIYSEQRAIRVKRVVDKKRISRLEPETKKRKNDTFVKRLEKNESKKSCVDDDTGKDSGDRLREKKPGNQNRVPLFPDESDEEQELSVEEQQQLTAENEQIYQEMNSVVDEVKQIEGKVVEISRLQEIFGEKVLEQEKDIVRIGETVVGTSENIKDANEEIREAMKNNAGLRVWILFFLIVLSLSLLFLDWYNP